MEFTDATIKIWGALAFGMVIGWYIYYVNRYRKGDVQIGDITSIIGAIGGAAVIALFRDPVLFGAYGMGLAIGFFLYFLVLILLVEKSDNFDADWFLDGRRKDPVEGYGYGRDARATVAAMSLDPRTERPATQNFYIGRAGAPFPAAQETFVERASSAPMQMESVQVEEAEDPAAPVDSDEANETADYTTARMLANIGLPTAGDRDDIASEVILEAAPGAAPLLAIDLAKAQGFLKACMTSNPRVKYGLGAKVPFHGAKPGREFKSIDCSGFVREAIRLATNPTVPFPDGSVVQHDWVRNRGFRRGKVADGSLDDGRIRIAFLRPQDSPSRIGHVVLIAHGKTLESHGGVGPDTRPWNGKGWQAKAFVYELANP
jgi:hypothetical protein